MSKTHRSIFLQEVKAAFPELRASLNAQHGLLHCEMHEFRFFVQGLIQNHEQEKLLKAFQIIERHYQYGNGALITAICVSFLEHLDLGLAKGEPSWAYSFLPQSLQQVYEKLRHYHGI